jgi:hypothetical protein
LLVVGEIVPVVALGDDVVFDEVMVDFFKQEGFLRLIIRYCLPI